MALLHRFQWKCRVRSVSDPELHQLFLLRGFSSSDPNNGNDDGGESGGESDSFSRQPSSQASSSSFLFDDVKSRLRRPSPPRQSIASSSSPVEPPDFLFSQRSPRLWMRSARTSPNSDAVPRRLFLRTTWETRRSRLCHSRSFYRSSLIGKKAEGEGTGDEQKPSRTTFDAIRESLQQIRNPVQARVKEAPEQPLFLRAFRDSLKLQPGEQPLDTKMRIRQVPERLPTSIFGKELGEKAAASESQRTEFVKTYDYKELGGGGELRKLRSEVKLKGKGGFSLEELSDRLRRLREMEEKETQLMTGGGFYKDIKDSL